ncbi:MAG: hypothetical protein M4579_005162 [Chaenotheca gracillima]|nr:MAG: hypothetical protein M4579_005162 [Chaenotheca gracillima]
MSAQTTPSRHASDFGPPGSGRNRQRTSSPLSINTTSGKNESGHFRITTNESDDLAKLVSGSDPLPDETSSLSKTLSSRSDPTNIAIEAPTDVNLSEGGIMVSGSFMAGKNWSQSGGGPTVASPNDSAVFSSSESDDALAVQDPNSILKFLDDHSDFSPTRKLSSFDPSSASRKIRFEDPNGLGFKDFSAKTPTEYKE